MSQKEQAFNEWHYTASDGEALILVSRVPFIAITPRSTKTPEW